MKDSFSSYHPLINFIYFSFIIFYSMVFMNPICLGISLLSAVIYSTYLNGAKSAKAMIKYMIPMVIITALINSIFNHQGATILLYLFDGNPLTMESILYGLGSSVMLVTVICWFSIFNVIMTSDKLIFLFGKILPSFSLLFSMVLRLVPRFKNQMKLISQGQKAIGRDMSSGNLFEKIRYGLNILSILITWTLENSIDMAESMRGRGYGLPGRTAFSIYKWRKRDYFAFALIVGLGSVILLLGVRGAYYYRYFPTMKGVEISIISYISFGLYLLMGLVPMVINIQEDRKWKLIQSKI